MSNKKGFYTNVVAIGNNILYRGVDENGRRIREKISDFRPSLFVPSNKSNTIWKSHLGVPLEEIQPGTIRETRDFIRNYEGVEGFDIYGNIGAQYQYIRQAFPVEEIPFLRQHILVANIDMEVDSSDGFPDVKQASKEITAITVEKNGEYHVFSLVPWDKSKTIHKDKIIHFNLFKDEKDLLIGFLIFWKNDYPDIVTGWNIRTFDIPYLIRRLVVILGENVAKTISPWNMISEKEVMFRQKMYPAYEIIGMSQLDMMQMFQKFSPDSSQENYQLDTIANVILGRGKVHYEGSLDNLYKTNPQKYIDYNIGDTELVASIDKEQGLIDLGLAMAYAGRSNYDDIFFPVRIWDVIAYNFLANMNIAVPPKQDNPAGTYEGAYVKPIKIGMFHGVASYDATAEYPSMMMMFNLSPETIVEGMKLDIDLEKLLEGNHDDLKIPEGCCVAASGYVFKKNIRGFIPKLVERVFDQRKIYKKISLDAEAEYEKTKNEEKRHIAKRYSTFEKAFKILANSLYGALGNRYYRFFDVRIAESITLSGQFCIRKVINAVNKRLNKIFSTDNIDYIIASDTDSIYVDMSAFTNKIENFQSKEQFIRFLDKACKKFIEPVIAETAQEILELLNAYEQRFFMKREVLADKAIWTGKKHYILNTWVKENVWYDKPKIKIVGLEAIKTSTPKICRKKIKESIEIIMSGTNEELISHIEKFKQEFPKYPIEHIAFPKGINGVGFYGKDSEIKDNQYANKTPIHVRGALLYNYKRNELKLEKKYPIIRDGDKIRYLYLKEPNPFQSYVIAFPDKLPPEFELEEYIDYETQYEKTFIDPMNDILHKIGWTSEIEANLNDLFGL
jgi:DNA polymerase elongation subunit (family B)